MMQSLIAVVFIIAAFVQVQRHACELGMVFHVNFMLNVHCRVHKAGACDSDFDIPYIQLLGYRHATVVISRF